MHYLRIKHTLLIGVAVILFASRTLARPGLRLADVQRIEPERLLSMMNDPNVRILDVRTNQDWTEATHKIKGAIREAPGEFSRWALKYPRDLKYILYCE